MILVEVTVFRADSADGERQILGQLVGSVNVVLRLGFQGLPIRNRFERLHSVTCVAEIEITDMKAFQAMQRLLPT